MKKKLKKSKRTRSVNADVESDEQGTHDTNPDSVDKPKRGRPAMIDYEKFVVAWSSLGTVSEVAKALGIQRNSASTIAARLRKEGVNLRNFPRHGAQPIDKKRLNKIAAEAGKAVMNDADD